MEKVINQVLSHQEGTKHLESDASVNLYFKTFKQKLS